jgi:hypothetical protein
MRASRHVNDEVVNMRANREDKVISMRVSKAADDKEINMRASRDAGD